MSASIRIEFCKHDSWLRTVSKVLNSFKVMRFGFSIVMFFHRSFGLVARYMFAEATVTHYLFRYTKQAGRHQSMKKEYPTERTDHDWHYRHDRANGAGHIHPVI